MSEKQIEPSPSVKKIEYPSKFSVKLKHYLYNLRHYARYPLRSGGAVTFASSIVILSVVVNAGIYLWKGSEHPTNNFRYGFSVTDVFRNEFSILKKSVLYKIVIFQMAYMETYWKATRGA